MTVTKKPKGRYLTHYAPETKIKTTKPAEQCAFGLFDWMKIRRIDLSPELLGIDTNNDMSNWKGGMLNHVEEFVVFLLPLHQRAAAPSYCGIAWWTNFLDKGNVVRFVSSFPKWRLNSEILLLSRFHFSNILLILAKIMQVK